MTFWRNPNQPEKFCVTTGGKALMITHKEDELKLIKRPLDASYASTIKCRYKTADINQYPLIKELINLIL